MTRIVFVYTAGMLLPKEKQSGTDLAVSDLFEELGRRWEIVPVGVDQIQTTFFQRQWGAMRDGAPTVIVDRLAGSTSAAKILQPGDQVVLADDYAGFLLRKGWNPAILIRHNAFHQSYAKVPRKGFVSHLKLGYTTWLARRFDRWTTLSAQAVVAPAGTTENHLKRLVPSGNVLPWRPRIPRQESGPIVPHPGKNLRGLFFANFQYGPNFEAFEYICHVLGPALKEMDAVIRVCGPWSKERAQELNVPPNIEVCGFQEDLVAFAKECDFGIVPIFHGEGILLKTLTLMGYGMPIVTSSMASAGTGLRHGVDAFVADDLASMVEAISRLRDPKVRVEMGLSAWKAAEKFSKSSGVVEAIESVIGAAHPIR